MTSNNQKQEKLPYQSEKPQTKVISWTGLKSRLSNWHRWLNIVLLFLVLEIAVLSIEQARWITPQPSLTLVLVLAMLAAWLLVRSRLPGIVAHFLALVIGILLTWWQATIVVAPGEAILYFAVFLAFLTWVMGYVATWFLLRRKNAWVGASLGATVILVNLSNLPGRYYFFFGFYFIVAMLLITMTRITKQHYTMEGSTGYPGRGLLYFAVSLVCLGILAVSIAWVTPEIRTPQLQTAIATRILWKHDIEESPINFFGAIPAKQPLNTSSTRRDLFFDEEWHDGDQIHFVVNTDRPSYWRVHVYDTYTTQGWTNSATDRYLLEKNVRWSDPGAFIERDKITYTVATYLRTDVLLTAGRFISSDTTVLLHKSEGEVFAVTTPRLLRPDERYTVTSIISSTSPESLSRAGTGYPKYLEDDYLQLPPDFPESVRQLSKDLVNEAKTPYDKIVAIDDYLSKIPYEEEIEAPPQGTDGVEHFLFTQKSGYCLHYASAMVVMLRSVDIPSRLVVGYLPGERDADTGRYILRDKHYHTWPQAYFQGYGWVDLEVTPSAESEVGIETPWVADQIIGEWRQQDAWVDWQMLAALYGQIYSGTDEASTAITFKSRRWPFADVLGTTLLYIIIGVAAAMVLISPVLAFRSNFYRWLWHVNRSDCAATEYAKMSALTSLLKLGPKPHQTPLEYAAELGSAFPQQAKAVDTVVQTYLKKRYGRSEGKLGLFEEAEVLKSRCDIYRTLLKRLSMFKKLFHK